MILIEINEDRLLINENEKSKYCEYKPILIKRITLPLSIMNICYPSKYLKDMIQYHENILKDLKIKLQEKEIDILFLKMLEK